MKIASGVYKLAIAIAAPFMFYWIFFSDQKPEDYYKMTINSHVRVLSKGKDGRFPDDQVFLKDGNVLSTGILKISIQDFQVNDSVVKKANSQDLLIYRDGKLIKHYQYVISD